MTTTVRVYLPVTPTTIAGICAGTDAASPGQSGYAVTPALLRELAAPSGSRPSEEAVELAEFEAFSQAVAAADRSAGRVVIVSADVASDAVVTPVDAPASSPCAAVELVVGVPAARVVCAHVSDPPAHDDPADGGPDPMSMSWYDASEFGDLARLLTEQ